VKIKRERLTFDTAATTATSAASGEIVNSTSASAAEEINEDECKQVGLSPAASSASGWMVNSTSATTAAEINEEECEQVGLSPTAGRSGASKGGGQFLT